MDIKEERDMLAGMVKRLFVDLCITSDQEISGADAQNLLDMEDEASEKIIRLVDTSPPKAYQVVWTQGNGEWCFHYRSEWATSKDFKSYEEAKDYADDLYEKSSWMSNRLDREDVKDIRLLTVSKIEEFENKRMF